MSKNISKSFHFYMVSLSFLFKFLKLKAESINFFLESISMIRFLLEISLTRENLSFTSRNLLSNSSNLSLIFVVRADLFIQIVLCIVTLFAKTMQSYQICIVSCFKVVVLKKFFVLKVAELCLNSVKLISESEIVFVTLLYLKYFCLKLTN